MASNNLVEARNCEVRALFAKTLDLEMVSSNRSSKNMQFVLNIIFTM